MVSHPPDPRAGKTPFSKNFSWPASRGHLGSCRAIILVAPGVGTKSVALLNITPRRHVLSFSRAKCPEYSGATIMLPAMQPRPLNGLQHVPHDQSPPGKQELDSDDGGAMHSGDDDDLDGPEYSRNGLGKRKRPISVSYVCAQQPHHLLVTHNTGGRKPPRR
jgi:hypothetical protein